MDKCEYRVKNYTQSENYLMNSEVIVTNDNAVVSTYKSKHLFYHDDQILDILAGGDRAILILDEKYQLVYYLCEGEKYRKVVLDIKIKKIKKMSSLKPLWYIQNDDIEIFVTTGLFYITFYILSGKSTYFTDIIEKNHLSVSRNNLPLLAIRDYGLLGKTEHLKNSINDDILTISANEIEILKNNRICKILLRASNVVVEMEWETSDLECKFQICHVKRNYLSFVRGDEIGLLMWNKQKFSYKLPQNIKKNNINDIYVSRDSVNMQLFIIIMTDSCAIVWRNIENYPNHEEKRLNINVSHYENYYGPFGEYVRMYYFEEDELCEYILYINPENPDKITKTGLKIENIKKRQISPKKSARSVVCL